MAGSIASLLLAALCIRVGYYALRLSRPARFVALIALEVVIAGGPLMVSAQAGVVRFLTALVSVMACLKLLDLFIEAGRTKRGQVLSYEQFRAFLRNPTMLVRRLPQLEKQPSAAESRRSLMHQAAMMLVACLLLVGLFSIDWSALPFFLEHASKFTVFFLMWISFMHVFASVSRLGGWFTLEPNRAPFLATTPADFWRRYNRWIGSALQENVFKPCGGRRHPATGILASFVVSGIFHEYLFAMSIGHPQGYQMLFFMLQGLAVVATMRIRPHGVAAWGGIVMTYVFNISSAVIFCASVQQIVPFYQNQFPVWLRGW